MSRAFIIAVFAAQTLAPAAQLEDSVDWHFNRLDQIGGHRTSVLCHPKIIQTPTGKAIQFNGVDDAIFLDVHPLAGAEAFTWEVIFRPDVGGAAEQRFFHLQERDPKTGADTKTRMLLQVTIRSDCGHRRELHGQQDFSDELLVEQFSTPERVLGKSNAAALTYQFIDESRRNAPE